MLFHAPPNFAGFSTSATGVAGQDTRACLRRRSRCPRECPTCSRDNNRGTGGGNDGAEAVHASRISSRIVYFICIGSYKEAPLRIAFSPSQFYRLITWKSAISFEVLEETALDSIV